MIHRLLKFINIKGINKNQFYKSTGLSNGFLDKVQNIGSSKLERILNTYPELNLEWLITGKGSMLKKSEEEVNETELVVSLRKNIALLEKMNDHLLEEVSELKERLACVKKELSGANQQVEGKRKGA